MRLNRLTNIFQIIFVLLSLLLSKCYGSIIFSNFTRPSYQIILRDEDICAGHPNPSFLPHPINCRYFIYCNDGNVNTVECPVGLAFNPARPPCDIATNVNCVDGTTGPFPTTTTPMTTTTTKRTTTPPTTTTTTTRRTTTTLRTTTTARPTTKPTTTTKLTTTTTKPTTKTTLRTTTILPPTTITTPTTMSTTTTQMTIPTTTTRFTTTTMSTTQHFPPPTIINPIEPAVKCPDIDDPDNVTYLSNNKNCSRYYMCYHRTPLQMSCASNLHWNYKINKCDIPENAQCTITQMPINFPICPRDQVQLFAHPLNCEWFLYCYHGHMTVQQCPFYYHWDVQTKSCQLKNIAKCFSMSTNNNGHEEEYDYGGW